MDALRLKSIRCQYDIDSETAIVTVRNGSSVTDSTGNDATVKDRVKKQRQLRRDRCWNVGGKKRKSLCIGPKYQMQLRQSKMKKTKNQRIEQFSNYRAIASSSGGDAAENSFNEVAIDRADKPFELPKISEDFQLMLANKRSDHPYDSSEHSPVYNLLPATGATATTTVSSANELSNSFQSSKTMYSTFGLRKLPKINKVVTPMRQQNVPAEPKRRIGICDLCSWSRLSINLKALILLICFVFIINLYNFCFN